MTVDAGKENDMAKKNIKMKRAAAVVLMLAALLSGCAGKHVIIPGSYSRDFLLSWIVF